ncbi:radical SAM protein [Geobacter pelophilus]|uniref:Radical SAM protein n=1 Tax=Geoanaerobacter pelophilus TaxID=60036 RepID=A0AAW4LB22_9BACT|nr:radical SAM protein [Geoanaerobacter pelophilus]MBT0666293.1 radical SAM protein [Geoanaerobacter pelophilus]
MNIVETSTDRLSKWFWSHTPVTIQRLRSQNLTEANWQLCQTQERNHSEYCPAFPEMLELELTKACNFMCTHCGTHGSSDQHRTNNKSTPIDIALLDQLAQDVFPYLRRISLVGEGEPFMAPRYLLLHLFKQLERTNTGLDISTNGALLDYELMFAMLPVLGDICFSLDAATKETFYLVRRSKDFDSVIETIKKLASLKQYALSDRRRFQIQLSFALRKTNCSELIDFLRMAAELQVDGVYVRQLLVHFPSMASETLIDKPEILNPLIEQASREAEKLGLSVFLPALINDSSHVIHSAPVIEVLSEAEVPQKQVPEQPLDANPQSKSRVNCAFLWRCMGVRSTGHVFSCGCLSAPLIGDIKTNSLAEIWNCETLRDMRKRLDTEDPHPACSHCWYREVSYFDSFEGSDFSLQNVSQPKEKTYDDSSFNSKDEG